MVRKSKQAGGHQPLTHYERTKKFKSSNYGTTSLRLSTDTQINFGDCSLSLQPATNNPVATLTSGHIYEQEAILNYMLTKTIEIKKQKEDYDKYLSQQQHNEETKRKEEHDHMIKQFESTQRATTNITPQINILSPATAGTKNKKDIGNSNNTSTAIVVKNDNDDKKRHHGDKFDNRTSKSAGGTNVLKRTSYWLAEVQPEHKETIKKPPPDRPASPNSGLPLRRKDIVPLHLERDNDSKDRKVKCSLSHKTITTQPVVALLTGDYKDNGVGAHVMLEDVYTKLVKPTMICPFTSKKIKNESKQVLKLQKGLSGFAGSVATATATGEGEDSSSNIAKKLVAKKYVPTIT